MPAVQGNCLTPHVERSRFKLQSPYLEDKRETIIKQWMRLRMKRAFSQWASFVPGVKVESAEKKVEAHKKVTQLAREEVKVGLRRSCVATSSP